jgi:hypothetical protein
MKYKIIIRGLLSYFPFLLKLVKKGKGSKGTGGTNSARYCYSVWMRHFIELKKAGFYKNPRTIAEIGPGDSMGIGLAAMLTGAEKYYAFDVIEHANLAMNLKVLDDLIVLLKNKTEIPGDDEFPKVNPKLDDYSFPGEYIKDFDLERLLDEKRIAHIKEALQKGKSGDFEIKYVVPWHSIVSEEINIDLMFSQAVLEHLDEIELGYNSMYNWLSEGGVISHAIDYSAHETHSIWNGHWGYSNLIWKIILHGRSYSINRLPHSAHVNLIERSGFEIFNLKRTIDKISINPASVSAAIRIGEELDMTTRSALIQAIKR